MTDEIPKPPPEPVPDPAPESVPPSAGAERAIEVEAIPASAEDTSGPTIDLPPPPDLGGPSGLGGPGPPPVIPPPPRRRWAEHLWAVTCHLLLFLVIPTVFLGAVLTFFVWQIFGKKDEQVEDQGREALNFQINVAAVTAILGATCLAAPLVPLVWLLALIFCLMAARSAANGERYRYPWVLRIVTH